LANVPFFGCLDYANIKRTTSEIYDERVMLGPFRYDWMSMSISVILEYGEWLGQKFNILKALSRQYSLQISAVFGKPVRRCQIGLHG